MAKNSRKARTKPPGDRWFVYIVKCADDGASRATLMNSFATTHWSLGLAAGKGASADTQASLEALCQTYWYPLYAYVRRHGYQPDDAQDLTQEFFARLLEKHYLQAADPERGRFRSFQLTAFKRFLSKERDGGPG
jgi:hypothetical protein